MRHGRCELWPMRAGGSLLSTANVAEATDTPPLGVVCDPYAIGTSLPHKPDNASDDKDGRGRKQDPAPKDGVSQDHLWAITVV
jgi:hypothetical protein